MWMRRWFVRLRPHNPDAGLDIARGIFGLNHRLAKATPGLRVLLSSSAAREGFRGLNAAA
jgi:hypothetical protein